MKSSSCPAEISCVTWEHLGFVDNAWEQESLSLLNSMAHEFGYSVGAGEAPIFDNDPQKLRQHVEAWGMVFLARVEGVLKGVLVAKYCSPGDKTLAHLDYLAVDRDFRHQHIGRTLLQQFEEAVSEALEATQTAKIKLTSKKQTGPHENTIYGRRGYIITKVRRFWLNMEKLITPSWNNMRSFWLTRDNSRIYHGRIDFDSRTDNTTT